MRSPGPPARREAAAFRAGVRVVSPRAQLLAGCLLLVAIAGGSGSYGQVLAGSLETWWTYAAATVSGQSLPAPDPRVLTGVFGSTFVVVAVAAALAAVAAAWLSGGIGWVSTAARVSDPNLTLDLDPDAPAPGVAAGSLWSWAWLCLASLLAWRLVGPSVAAAARSAAASSSALALLWQAWWWQVSVGLASIVGLSVVIEVLITRMRWRKIVVAEDRVPTASRGRSR